MTAPTTASPVVQAILTAARAAMVGPLVEVAVLDGIDQQQAYTERSVTIGGTWDAEVEQFTTSDTVAVETTESGAGRRLTEVTSVASIAYSGGGELSLADHRLRVNATLTALRDGLRAITLVDGKSARAQLSSQQWAQVLDAQGAGVMAMFSVAVSVLL